MNAKHQFKYTYKDGCEDFSPVEVTFEIPGDVTLTQMLYNFESYLKACGFHFDGKLDFVEEEFDSKDDKLAGWSADDWEDETAGCCMGDPDKECGCTDTSSPLETSEFDKQFDVTRTTASSKDSKWSKAEKMLKEWNEGIAKLDNEQLQKAMKQAHEMSGLHYEATKEVVKNNWVHGMCNPPSPDWKKK